MLITLFIREFPFNNKFNGVFKNTYNKKDISVTASSSRECYFYSLKKDVSTKPESVIDPEDNLEWCSDINKSENDRPWLATTFKDKKFTMSGYSIKSGCCKYSGSRCCCRIYSWSIHGSNDNKTWTKIHSVEKSEELDFCTEKSFLVDKKGSFSMFKIIQDEPQPDCWFCMDISRLEFYGTIQGDVDDEISSEDEISIIGRFKAN